MVSVTALTGAAMQPTVATYNMCFERGAYDADLFLISQEQFLIFLSEHSWMQQVQTCRLGVAAGHKVHLCEKWNFDVKSCHCKNIHKHPFIHFLDLLYTQPVSQASGAGHQSIAR